MSGSRFTCPACDAVLKLAGEINAGKKIKCPKCNTVFRIPEPVKTQVREDRPNVRRSVASFDYESKHRARRRLRRAARSGMKPAILALILVPVALLAIGALAGGAWLVVSKVNSEKDKELEVAANTSNDDDSISTPRIGNLPPPIIQPPANKPPAPPENSQPPNEPPPADNPPPPPNNQPPANPPPAHPPPPPIPDPKLAVPGTEFGNIALEIVGSDIDGHRFRLSDYRGKVVVLDFWGHW